MNAITRLNTVIIDGEFIRYKAEDTGKISNRVDAALWEGKTVVWPGHGEFDVDTEERIIFRPIFNKEKAEAAGTEAAGYCINPRGLVLGDFVRVGEGNTYDLEVVKQDVWVKYDFETERWEV